MSEKKGLKVGQVKTGQKRGRCSQCYPKDYKWWRPLYAMRAVYIRLPLRGFVRIGWFFEECGHVVIDGSWLKLESKQK